MAKELLTPEKLKAGMYVRYQDDIGVVRDRTDNCHGWPTPIDALIRVEWIHRGSDECVGNYSHMGAGALELVEDEEGLYLVIMHILATQGDACV